MIFQYENGKPEGALRDRLADRLLEQAPVLCGNPALASSDALCEAAQGVAAVLREQETLPHELTPHSSCNLLARALQASGEPALARRMQLAGSASVYAASWVTAGQDTVWTLDARKLMEADSPCTELSAFSRLREVLDACADVWDGTCGRGILGLRRLPGVIHEILGRHAAPAERRRLAGEMRDYCAHCLDMQRRQRGWQAAPVVMSMES